MRVERGAGGPRLVRTPPLRPPGEHAVRVRVELAGLCRSDLKEVAGKRHGVSQFGHEIVGSVEESTLDSLPRGARVTLDPNVPIQRGTGFATQMWVAGPANRLTEALPVIPHEVTARRLVFTEPLACVRHCLTAASRHFGRDLDGARVAVLGAGTAGVLIAGLARASGATVVLGNRSADRTAFVRERLDVPVCPMAELPLSDVDIAVVATSFVLPEVLSEALRVVTPGGLVLLYGGTAPGAELSGLDCAGGPVDLDSVRRGETSVRADWHGKPVIIGGSYGTAPEDFPAAVRALVDLDPAVLPVERLITSEVRLAELPDVLRAQVSGRPLGKTLVRP
jgi:threonine dehydrogenase-like Zn-dependent dehydrogenase